MEKAKAAVGNFLDHNNKHSVDIEQTTVAPVTHERVQTAQHENVTTAIDREIHQHHHQTHVQPIAAKEVLPETHTHKVAAVEHRQHHHGKDREIEAALQEQVSQFRDEREVLPTQMSQSTNTIVGEHVHHHIHDIIQPVIEKETIQQQVVHTTIPIHERIDKAPVIHSANVLPTKTLAEFESAGHSLTGGVRSTTEHIDYEGEPLKIKDDSKVGFDHHRHHGAGTTGVPGELGTAAGAIGTAGIVGGATHHHHHHKTTAGPHDSNLENKLDPRVDSDLDGRSGLGNTTGAGTTGYGTTGAGYGTTGTTTGGVGPHNSSLENKLDPRVDSDGSKGYGAGATTGTQSSTTGTTGTGYGSSASSMIPGQKEYGLGNTANTGLGSGNTGVSEAAPTRTDTTASDLSTKDKLLNKIGLGSK